MTERRKRVDAVIIGYGWAGAIMAKALTDAGLSVVALERGPARDTSPDFEYPRIADELKYGVRGDLWQSLAKETVTIRHGINDVAAPYRKYGSFILGNGVGGAGVHWNGSLWRASPEDLRLRSHILDPSLFGSYIHVLCAVLSLPLAGNYMFTQQFVARFYIFFVQRVSLRKQIGSV